MSADGLEQYLQQWRAGKRNSPVTTTTTTRGGETVGAIPPKRRSFRPHRIVPQLYLGALKDVQDTWALHQRLLPEKMLLVVSTCDRGDRPRLEMRQLLPAATATRQQGSCRVRRLAVCSWEELEAHVGDASRKAAATVVSVAATAEWLQKAVESRSFAGNDGRGEASDDGSSAHGGVVYLKLCLPWSDEPSCLVHVHFDVAIALMRAVVDGLGRAVVCHCVAGVSRSVTLVCAFLLRCWCDARATGEMPRSSGDAVKAVVEFVREVRLCACPNAGFMQQLTEYASGLLSAETVGALCRWMAGCEEGANTGPDASHSAEGGGGAAAEEVLSVLLCMQCRAPICRYEDIFSNRATDVWAAQVYAYELDLFDDKPPLWCYSATNPSARRFDLVRCDAAIAVRDRVVQLRGEWSSEHSFFVGHEWCFSECAFCSRFLGWGFRALREAPDSISNNNNSNSNASAGEDGEGNREVGTGASFIGVILTHCVGKDNYPRAKYDEAMLAATNLSTMDRRLPSLLNALRSNLATFTNMDSTLQAYPGFRGLETALYELQDIMGDAEIETVAISVEDALSGEQENAEEEEEEEGGNDNNGEDEEGGT